MIHLGSFYFILFILGQTFFCIMWHLLLSCPLVFLFSLWFKASLDSSIWSVRFCFPPPLKNLWCHISCYHNTTASDNFYFSIVRPFIFIILSLSVHRYYIWHSLYNVFVYMQIYMHIWRPVRTDSLDWQTELPGNISGCSNVLGFWI